MQSWRFAILGSVARALFPGRVRVYRKPLLTVDLRIVDNFTPALSRVRRELQVMGLTYNTRRLMRRHRPKEEGE